MAKKIFKRAKWNFQKKNAIKCQKKIIGIQLGELQGKKKNYGNKEKGRPKGK